MNQIERKVVKTFWHGHQIGDIQRIACNSFLQNGYDYEVYCFGDVELPAGATRKDASQYLSINDMFTIKKEFNRGVCGASDWFRYLLLNDLGGWWVDADIVCIRPFSWDKDYFFPTEVNGQCIKVIGNYMLKSKRDAPILHHAIRFCQDADKEKIEWPDLGPRLMTDIVPKFGLSDCVGDLTSFNPINYTEFRSLVEHDRPLDDCYVLHLWHSMWRHQGIDPALEYPGTTYGNLRRRFLA